MAVPGDKEATFGISKVIWDELSDTDMPGAKVEGEQDEYYELRAIGLKKLSYTMAVGVCDPILENTWLLGDGTDTDKIIEAETGAVNLPQMKYNAAAMKWQYTDDGINWFDFGVSGGGAGSGNMRTETYDMDENGIVDRAEMLDDGAGGALTIDDIMAHFEDNNIHIDWTDTDEDFKTSGGVEAGYIHSGLWEADQSMEIAPLGDIILNPGGRDMLPKYNYSVNIGAVHKKILSLHAAELIVENLVAQDTMTQIEGKVLIGKSSTKLTADLGKEETEIYVEHNNLSSGDNIYMLSRGTVEFMQINSASAGSGPYVYTVIRDLDGTGANDWFAGDALFNTGHDAGDGFIEMYALSGILGTAGPTIVGNIRLSSIYNDWVEGWAIGNLNGLYGYAADTMGVALGKYAADKYSVLIDETNGIRMIYGVWDPITGYTVTSQWKTDGGFIFGDVATSVSHFKFDPLLGCEFKGIFIMSGAGSSIYWSAVTDDDGHKPEDDATYGANWASNLANIPADIFYKLSDDILDITWQTTYLSEKMVASPFISGNLGYFTEEFRVGASGIVIDGTNKKIYSKNFSSGLVGWCIDNDDSAEFNDIIARGDFIMTGSSSSIKWSSITDDDGHRPDSDATLGADWASNLANIPADIFHKLSDDILDITWQTTYLSGKLVASPYISGNLGYFTQEFRVGANGIVIDGTNKKIYSKDFLTGVTGWCIDNDNSAEFNDIIARGTIHASGGTFTGYVEASSGGMRFGKDAGGAGKHGIYIDSNDFWYGDGKISIANGGLIYDGATFTFAGNITSTANISGGSFSVGYSAEMGSRFVLQQVLGEGEFILQSQPHGFPSKSITMDAYRDASDNLYLRFGGGVDVNGTMIFSNDKDVNLYRQAANRLATDRAFSAFSFNLGANVIIDDAGNIQCLSTFKSSDGSSGSTVTKSWSDPVAGLLHTQSFKNGLLVDWTAV